MDFTDRLAEFLRSLMGNKGDESTGQTGNRPGGGAGYRGSDPGYRDPDLRAAWEELEDYMRGGSGTPGQSGGAGSERSGPWSRGDGRRRAEPPVDESLRQDFANLEVPFGADIETVRRSYKAMILKYHPDKFAGDPEKQRVALEITKKINESFERIRNRQ